MPGAVFVVDGDEEMRDLFRAILARVGHSVWTFASLEEAEASPQPADVVMVDVLLAPEGDLAAFAGRVSTGFPSREIVYLVNEPETALKRKLEKARLRHFVRPFQIEDLRELVNKLLERRLDSRR